jgi:hypothetical protein
LGETEPIADATATIETLSTDTGGVNIARMNGIFFSWLNPGAFKIASKGLLQIISLKIQRKFN